MTQYALVGQRLGHSFSQGYFRDKFAQLGLVDHDYLLLELDTIEDLTARIAQMPGLVGFNVTIPYKEAILPYLTSMSSEAQRIGAVNTIKIHRQGDGECWLQGFNTDVVGFVETVKVWVGVDGKTGGLGRPASAWVLGAGGSAKAVRAGLETLGIAWQGVSRRVAPGIGGSAPGTTINYDALTSAIRDGQRPAGMGEGPTLIINTTPLGMWPDTDDAPVLPYTLLHPGYYLYDLVYNPAETRFMQLGALQGCPVHNGLAMLYAQAEAAWAIWQA